MKLSQPFPKGNLNAIWIGIKIDIYGATKKWNAAVNNGKKGGRPKKVEQSAITKTPAPIVEPTPSFIDKLNSLDDEDLTTTDDEYGDATFKLGNGLIV